MCMGHDHNHDEVSIFDEPFYNDDIDLDDDSFYEEDLYDDDDELLEDSFYDEDLYEDFIGYNPDYDDGDF